MTRMRRTAANRLTAAAAAYALYGHQPGSCGRSTTGNRTRLIVNGGHVEHWLNGARSLNMNSGARLEGQGRIEQICGLCHYGLRRQA